MSTITVSSSNDNPLLLKKEVTIDATITANIIISESDQVLADKAYDEVIKAANGLKVTQNNIIQLVGIVIQIIESISTKQKIANSLKKNIAIFVIQKFVGCANGIEEMTKTYLEQIFIPTMLSGVIDSLCNLDVHEIVRTVSCCLGLLCSSNNSNKKKK
jgi:hypothetical protein